MFLPTAGRSAEGQAGTKKEEVLCEMNRPSLGAAAGEERMAWGEWPFAQLADGMSSGKADGWQSLVQPWMVGGCLLPLGTVGSSPWAPSRLFSPRALGAQRLVPGLWTPGAGNSACCSLCFQEQQQAVCRLGAQGRAPHLAESHVSVLLPRGPEWAARYGGKACGSRSLLWVPGGKTTEPGQREEESVSIP